MPILLPILLLAALYLFVLPKRRQAAAQRAAATGVEPGDTVLIGGCIFGTLLSHDAQGARIEVSPGVVLEVLPRTFRKADPPPPPLIDATDDVDAEPDQAPAGSTDASDEPLAPGHEES